MKYGGYRYETGTTYVGTWNVQGRRQGEGHIIFPDGNRYDGCFDNGFFSGLGIIRYADGAKYVSETKHAKNKTCSRQLNRLCRFQIRRRVSRRLVSRPRRFLAFRRYETRGRIQRRKNLGFG